MCDVKRANRGTFEVPLRWRVLHCFGNDTAYVLAALVVSQHFFASSTSKQEVLHKSWKQTCLLFEDDI